MVFAGLPHPTYWCQKRVLAILERSENHSKYASEIHTLLQPKLKLQTVTKPDEIYASSGFSK